MVELCACAAPFCNPVAYARRSWRLDCAQVVSRRRYPMTTAIAMDNEAFKAATRKQWDEAAQSWDDHTPAIRAWLRSATDAMLDMALVRPGARVLDVAAGAGDQTLDLADRVGPTGVVVATDLSPAILELAQANAGRAGFANVETLAADGEHLGVDVAAF